jgi:hypothetical protein
VTDRTRVECATEEQAEEEQEETAGVSHRGRPGGERRGGGCDGFDGTEECPEGTLAVGAAIHEAVLRHGWDGPEYVEIEVLTS